MVAPMRNYPPENGIRVPVQRMRDFLSALFGSVGASEADAAFMGDMLSRSDLRCVFSHGSRAALGYARLMRDGGVNPRPHIKVESCQGATAVVDGDGGLGYMPAWKATELAIEAAGQCGVGAATSRNHFHFGSAGHYSRRALEHGYIGLATSAHRFELPTESPVWGAASVSPLSVALPAGDQPPLVLDMGAGLVPRNDETFSRLPGAVLKSLGLGAVFMGLGGVLAGIWKEENRDSPFIADQGAFIAVFDVERFMPLAEFKAEMDRYIGQARCMKPLPGMEQAELAGGMEWHWEKQNSRAGIPVGDEHRRILLEAADEFGVAAPFADEAAHPL
jgi:L-2-hydroxycarboxylate dehydrogenase (NAD+)